jgi:2-hydroxychromene-2-carboxylate isomerase
LKNMGELVLLDDRRRRRPTRATPEPPKATLYVDLADPFSYLTGERVERTLPRVTWRLARQQAFAPAPDPVRLQELRRAAELRAGQLRLPLQWPDRFPSPVPAAMRAAAYAVGSGRGGAFILAAGRLAFCGGFDLDDPEVLMEAAAAAGIALDECLEAARDGRWDAPVEAASRQLARDGAERVPALRAGRALVWSEERISAYLAAGAHQRAAGA